MDKAIKIHCMHCAVWQVVPITHCPKTVLKGFQDLQVTADEIERQGIWDKIIFFIKPPFATFSRNFDGGGYYVNNVPQSDEIHTDADGKRHRIIGSFSENYCEG